MHLYTTAAGNYGRRITVRSVLHICDWAPWLMMNCLCEFVSNVWVRLYGIVHGYRSVGLQGQLQQETLLDQVNTRLVQLELQDRRCIADARRHRTAGAKTLFRSKMLEHRRVQGQIVQMQRFRENAMAQFDALSNHELNKKFVKTMKSMVGEGRDRMSDIREDAETVMGDYHDSISQVKDMSDFLGQQVSVDDIDDSELELEFLEEVKHSEDRANDKPFVHAGNGEPLVVPTMQRTFPISSGAENTANRIEDMLVIRPMLPSFQQAV